MCIKTLRQYILKEKNSIYLSLSLSSRRLDTVTISSDSESEVEFVEENKIAVSERSRAKCLPFQLNLQVVCLLGTGGYGKVFLVKTKGKMERKKGDIRLSGMADPDLCSCFPIDDLSKQHLLTVDSNSQAGVNLSPDQGKKRAGRGRPRKIQVSEGKTWCSFQRRCRDRLLLYNLAVYT